MNVASEFGSCKSILQYISPTAAYRLAAPSAPIKAKDEATDLAEQGERVTEAVAKSLIQKHGGYR